MDTQFENLINDIVATMQLPTTDSEGNPITYDANKLAEEIMAYKDEINALNDYVNNYAKYNNSEAYANMTLLQKLQSMINQLNQASNDAQAQLTLAEAKIVKLGHCPKDEGALTNGTCAICNTHYDGAGTGSDITTGGGKENEQQPSGGSSSGTGGTTNPPAQEQQPSGGGSTGGDNTNNNDTQQPTMTKSQAWNALKTELAKTSLNSVAPSKIQSGEWIIQADGKLYDTMRKQTATYSYKEQTVENEANKDEIIRLFNLWKSL